MLEGFSFTTPTFPTAAMGGCNGRLQWAAAVASNFPTLELLNRYLI